MLKTAAGLLLFSSAELLTFAGSAAEPQPAHRTPYQCRHVDDRLSLGRLREIIAMPKNTPAEPSRAFTEGDRACNLLQAAERYKRLGDPRAAETYEQAIKASANPAYSLFYGDYLRNTRGASKPLYEAADRQYREARARLAAISRQDIDECRRKAQMAPDGVCEYDKIDAEIRRGLSYLHARDGLPVTIDNASSSMEGPQLYVSVSSKLGYTTSDFDRPDDARAFTSAALFSESAIRLNRPLTLAEQKDIARGRTTFEMTTRATLRWDGLPSLDLIYHKNSADQAQITNFYDPAQANDISVEEFGLHLEQTGSLSRSFDFTLGAGYSRVDRKGLVEFLPDAHERINQVKSELALSTFWNATKVTLDTIYVRQFIDVPVLPAYKRDRSIYGTSLTFYDPSERRYPLYGTKGREYIIGFAYDIETFGDVDVPKNDYFVGVIFHAMQPFGDGDSSPLIDLSIRPALLSSAVAHDHKQTTWDYRTDVQIGWRILDQDRARPVWGPIEADSISLGVPFRHDVAVKGPSYYDNYRIGLRLDTVFAAHALGGTKFLASIGYDHQTFYNINKSLNLLNVQLSAGY